MIKLTQTVDSGYFTTKTGERVYLCDEGLTAQFGFIPREIKVYNKNPKEKGMIKVERPLREYVKVKVKNATIWIDTSAAIILDREIPSKIFWVTVK